MGALASLAPIGGAAMRWPPARATRSMSRLHLLEALGPRRVVVHDPLGEADRAGDGEPEVADALGQVRDRAAFLLVHLQVADPRLDRAVAGLGGDLELLDDVARAAAGPIDGAGVQAVAEGLGLRDGSRGRRTAGWQGLRRGWSGRSRGWAWPGRGETRRHAAPAAPASTSRRVDRSFIASFPPTARLHRPSRMVRTHYVRRAGTTDYRNSRVRSICVRFIVTRAGEVIVPSDPQVFRRWSSSARLGSRQCGRRRI